jgi:hypothetical protein
MQNSPIEAVGLARDPEWASSAELPNSAARTNL